MEYVPFSPELVLMCRNIVHEWVNFVSPHPAAAVDHGLPVRIDEHLLERVDEGLLSIMRGPVSVPLSHAAHKKVQGIQIWQAMGPYIPQKSTEFSQIFLKISKFQLF